MAKVYPQAPLLSSSSSSGYLTSKQETFTIWMKSLIVNGHGCTVFDSNGQIVYRVDNYDSRGRAKVHLMDLKGQILFSILRKKSKFLGVWEGYRSSNGKEINPKNTPSFQVRRCFKGKSACKVIVGLDKNQIQQYRIESWSSGKSACKILDKSGRLVAEVKRKQSTCGVVLGEDVLTLVVEPFMDHSLIVGLLVVYGLINRKL
ncbi:PREDICTED: protein LURP-one-related 11-like isoform X2 [Fragaria vesca subsp. vesca]|uniref:protein LURP-one-related 11-like isoform X2 n=1 Tax=Fragaria vesca subsp. vesca TaxID=101020 RepID=UPI0002C30384|nr:PREDICTED: protein LURP-one-related 11-like isoform X2 [Fragaria vesca subsp. vesca]